MKQEKPNVDAYERAMEHDRQTADERPARLHLREASTTTTPRYPPPETKEPTEVMLYGYSPSCLWEAIWFYETASSGIICEDYERVPPSELQGFPDLVNPDIWPRPRTPAERASAFQYRGGNAWIKVTFDSAAAADRAISHSPHFLQGHWVYAQRFNGTGPEVDQPIKARVDAPGKGKLGGSTRSWVEGGPSFLAPSAAKVPEAPPPTRDDIPGIPRTDPRPANEAFLKQPTWFEATVATLTDWIPDLIGDVLPPLENGAFDWAHASYIRRGLYYVNSLFLDVYDIEDEMEE